MGQYVKRSCNTVLELQDGGCLCDPRSVTVKSRSVARWKHEPIQSIADCSCLKRTCYVPGEARRLASSPGNPQLPKACQRCSSAVHRRATAAAAPRSSHAPACSAPCNALSHLYSRARQHVCYCHPSVSLTPCHRANAAPFCTATHAPCSAQAHARARKCSCPASSFYSLSVARHASISKSRLPSSGCAGCSASRTAAQSASSRSSERN